MKGHKSNIGGQQEGPHGHGHSTPPPSAAAYIPPTVVPKESKYHTLDMKAVRLAPEIDPQRMKTQMAIWRRSTAAPALDPSVWVSLCLAGAALGLGVWWGVQWWRERARSPEPRTQDEVVLAVPTESRPRSATSSQASLRPLPPTTLAPSDLRASPPAPPVAATRRSQP